MGEIRLDVSFVPQWMERHGRIRFLPNTAFAVLVEVLGDVFLAVQAHGCRQWIIVARYVADTCGLVNQRSAR